MRSSSARTARGCVCPERSSERGSTTTRSATHRSSVCPRWSRLRPTLCSTAATADLPPTGSPPSSRCPPAPSWQGLISGSPTPTTLPTTSTSSCADPWTQDEAGNRRAPSSTVRGAGRTLRQSSTPAWSRIRTQDGSMSSSTTSREGSGSPTAGRRQDSTSGEGGCSETLTVAATSSSPMARSQRSRVRTPSSGCWMTARCSVTAPRRATSSWPPGRTRPRASWPSPPATCRSLTPTTTASRGARHGTSIPK